MEQAQIHMNGIYENRKKMTQKKHGQRNDYLKELAEKTAIFSVGNWNLQQTFYS